MKAGNNKMFTNESIFKITFSRVNLFLFESKINLCDIILRDIMITISFNDNLNDSTQN